MRRSVATAIKIVFTSAVLFAVIGFFRGKYYLAAKGVNWWMPDDLNDKDSFIVVGSIHNYSYLGGIVGLLIALIYMIRKSIILKQEASASQ